MVNARKLPIAILTDDVPYAIVWALNKYSKVEMYSAKRREIVANGREFIICSMPEHLLGIEIERYVTAYNENSPKKLSSFKINMERLAKTRVRD